MSKSPPIVKRSSSWSSQSARTLSTATCLGLVMFLLIVSVADNQINRHNLVEARYLPTRSDDSNLEVLKEIIKNLLDEAATSGQQEEAAANYQAPLIRQARFYSTQNRAGQQRRRYLLSRSNNNNNNILNGNQAGMLLIPQEMQSFRSPAFVKRRDSELASNDPNGSEPMASRQEAAAASGLDSQETAGQAADR